MRTLSACSIGALLAVQGTAVFDPTVHLGQHVVGGWARYAVAALGGALGALVIRWALRSESRL